MKKTITIWKTLLACLLVVFGFSIQESVSQGCSALKNPTTFTGTPWQGKIGVKNPMVDGIATNTPVTLIGTDCVMTDTILAGMLVRNKHLSENWPPYRFKIINTSLPETEIYDVNIENDALRVVPLLSVWEIQPVDMKEKLLYTL